MMSPSFQVLVQWIIISSISIACYINSLWGGFVFDDNEAVVKNRDVVLNSSLEQLFTDDFWGINVFHSESHKSYRPFTVLTFRWNYWLVGELNPFLFHITNVFLHPVVCILYYEVCRCLCEENTPHNKAKQSYWLWCPFIASVMFAVHPVHTESVAGVVGRAELLSAIFYFQAFLCYIFTTSLKSTFLLVVGVFFTVTLAGCAMLFKEQGLTVLGLCFAYDVLFKIKQEIQRRRLAIRFVFMSIYSMAILTARFFTGSPKFKPVDNPASFSDSLLTRVLSYNYVYALNFWLLLNPSWLCFDWSMGCISLLNSINDCRFAVVLILWLVFGCLLLYSCFGRKGYLKTLVIMSAAMIIIPFLPASNLFIKVGFVIAERVLYLPSAGWCLLLALGLSKILIRHKSLCASLFTLLTLTFITKSIQRSGQWQTEHTLFVSGLTVCPHNAKILYNIGKTMSDMGQTSVAETAYRRAIRLNPEYDHALNNLGNLLKENNQIKEAEDFLQRAVSVNPKFAAAWMNLGLVKAVLKKSKEAESCYKKAINIRKNYPDAYYNLGNLYIDCERPDDAAAAFTSAINIHKKHINAWNNLGLLYENQGMYVEAEKVLREAVKEFPAYDSFYNSLGILMGKLRRWEEAKELLMKAISINPTSANYHANLGVVYQLTNDYEKAEQFYSHALQLKPDLVVAKDNLKKLESQAKGIKQ